SITSSARASNEGVRAVAGDLSQSREIAGILLLRLGAKATSGRNMEQRHWVRARLAGARAPTASQRLLFMKPCRVLFKRQVERVGKIGHGTVEAAEQDDLEDFCLVIVRRQRLEFLFA